MMAASSVLKCGVAVGTVTCRHRYFITTASQVQVTYTKRTEEEQEDKARKDKNCSEGYAADHVRISRGRKGEWGGGVSAGDLCPCQ
ncbi:hypothetical protein BaRGS_00014163, partial [Batillaria attramentaria]